MDGNTLKSFEIWFNELDIYKVDPFTEVMCKEDIKGFLLLAWEDGFAEGYDVCGDDLVDLNKYRKG